MTMFSTKNVQETVAGGGNNQTYIYGGVYHDVRIKDVMVHTAGTGTKALRIEMYTKDGGADTARAFDFYFSEKSAKIQMAKLKHITTKVAKEAEFEAIEANNLDELAAGLKPLLKGKRLRMKFNAEQYQNQNGEVKDRPTIGLPDFAEAIVEGAEHSPVADEDTKLVYDKNNEYDYKKLDIQPTSEDSVESDAMGLDDL